MTLDQPLLAFMSFFSSLSLKLGWTSDTLFGWKKKCSQMTLSNFWSQVKNVLPLSTWVSWNTCSWGSQSPFKTPAPQETQTGYMKGDVERGNEPHPAPSTSYLQGEAAAMWVKKPSWTFDSIGSASDSGAHQGLTAAERSCTSFWGTL